MTRRRKARRRKKRDEGRRWEFEALFLGLLVALSAIAFFLTDFKEVRYGWQGSYLWVVAYILSFFIFLLYLLQFALPLPWFESVKEGLILILEPTFFYTLKLARKGLRRSFGKAAEQTVLEELPSSFELYRAGVLPSYQVLAITRGPKFERAVGPGYVRLARGETVAQVIDLRKQVRNLPVKAMTRDGIPIETTVKVSFQVKLKEPSAATILPYPYDPGAIFGVNYISNYRSENGILSWGDRIVRAASGILIDELAKYKLDELYRPGQTSIIPPRQRIAGRMKQKLRTEFESRGVIILGAGPGPLEVPDEVVEQLKSNWQTEWQRRINKIEAATENAAMQRLKLAQARAEIEVITTITESIQSMLSSGDGKLTDIVTIRMLEAMREAAEDEQVKAMVPSQALDTMRQLQEWLGDWDTRV
ncbi:MAG: SPFH domain-containing protein [Chloroflexota bacterium]|jgi:hypothetical protein